MRKHLRTLTVTVLLMGCGSLSLRANSMVNGSFEAPVVPVGSFENFSAGSNAITGWTVVGPQVSVVSGSFAEGCCTFPAEDGVQWLDLTGDGANSVEGVQQTVATTPGTEYTLSFWVGNVFNPGGIFGTTSTVKVYLGGINGTLIDSATNSSMNRAVLTWQQFSVSFTATGASTTLDFINGDPVNDNSNGLDNVVLGPSVVTTPEPASVLLLASALMVGGLAKLLLPDRA